MGYNMVSNSLDMYRAMQHNQQVYIRMLLTTTTDKKTFILVCVYRWSLYEDWIILKIRRLHNDSIL